MMECAERASQVTRALIARLLKLILGSIDPSFPTMLGPDTFRQTAKRVF